MKLTLEHLAPYLPYALEVMVKCDGQQYKATITGFYHFSAELHIECNNGLPGLYRFNTEEEYVKPILKPLSDYKDINSKEMSELNFDLSDQMDLCDLANQHTNIEGVRYQLAKICFENYIDVFGLIEKGLAINTNDL